MGSFGISQTHSITYGLIWYLPNSSYNIWTHLVSPKLILQHIGSFGISQTYPTTYRLIWYLPNSSYYIWAHLVSPQLILLHMGSFGISQTHPTTYGLIWYLPNSSYYMWAHLVSLKLILLHVGSFANFCPTLQQCVLFDCCDDGLTLTASMMPQCVISSSCKVYKVIVVSTQ